MDFIGWTAALGGLLLVVSLASGWIRRMPATTFVIYLLAGIVVGPWEFGLLDVRLPQHAQWLVYATDIALVISLFVTGLKLRLSLGDSVWITALRLAAPAMVLTIAAMAWIAHVMAGLAWPIALLVGAMVAPTDPVLASLVSVDDARDGDRMRIALSGEAGLNDGLALPFLMLGLLLVQGHPLAAVAAAWAWRELLWALVAGAGIGFAAGWLIGMVGARLRAASGEVSSADFLALSLMALAYAGAESVHASGFLAAFAAGLGLRQAELQLMTKHHQSRTHDEHADGIDQPPAEVLVNRNSVESSEAREPVKSVGLVVSDAMFFGDTIERLLAAAAVFLIGVSLVHYWSMTGLLLAGVLFVLVRPLAVYLSTMGSGLPRGRRLLFGWLGIRGIGTLNYLLYALSHGVTGAAAAAMSAIAITVVALSIVVHGITTPPLVSWRQRRLDARQQRDGH